MNVADLVRVKYKRGARRKILQAYQSGAHVGRIFGRETDDGLSRVFFKQRNAGSPSC